jgi:hypothetical protein
VGAEEFPQPARPAANSKGMSCRFGIGGFQAAYTAFSSGLHRLRGPRQGPSPGRYASFRDWPAPLHTSQRPLHRDLMAMSTSSPAPHSTRIRDWPQAPSPAQPSKNPIKDQKNLLTPASKPVHWPS